MENIQLSNILHIQEASKQGKLVMFVGAGVSANSGVPMAILSRFGHLSFGWFVLKSHNSAFMDIPRL